MAITLPEVGPDVTLKFGPMLIGVFINMILYGVLIMQTLTYYQTYKNDQWYIKALVYYLFVIETLNTGLDIGVMYEPLIVRYATARGLAHFPIAFAAEPVIIGMISTPIQFFIAYRIRKISKSIWIPLLICVLGLVSLGGSVWTTYSIAEFKLFARKPELHNPALVWLLSASAADVLLTASLVRALYRKKTGFKLMDSVINKIIRLTVQTGMITAICAIGDVVFFMTLPHTTLNFIWDLSLAKLYANSLMSTLNARATLNGALNVQEPNFLWDDDTATTNSRSAGMSFNTRGTRRDTHPYPVSSPRAQIFELEASKSYNSSHYSPHHDSPYTGGISVTIDRVVETVEDPLPKRYSAGMDVPQKGASITQ